MKNRMRNFSILLICFISVFFSGCSKSKQENSILSNSEPKTKNTISNNDITNTKNSKKEIELLDYVGKSINDIKKDFGEPNKIDGTQSGELYDYNNFYFAINNDKVVTIVVKGTDATVNGIEIGMIPKDVKIKLGTPLKESNSNNFVMEYRLNNNTISIQYSCVDFRSPVNSITITDLTFGKEKPMEVTKENILSLIEGNWILEENINQPNLPLYMHTFKNGIQDEKLGIWSEKYRITSNNTIVFHYLVNDFSGTREEDTEYYIEFYENGDRMEIYLLDEYGDRDIDYEKIYYRYN